MAGNLIFSTIVQQSPLGKKNIGVFGPTTIGKSITNNYTEAFGRLCRALTQGKTFTGTRPATSLGATVRKFNGEPPIILHL